ncbi:glycine/D-amino acid oxidase-like deaminating enzyme [Streptomyces pseudovenezuelae]
MAPSAMSRWTKALSEAQPVPYWLDDPGRPHPEPALTSAETCDLLVVGGGYSGLWTALNAKERDPERDVVLLEGREVGWAASGRNGGFCAASLTHGLPNGLTRWPDEIHRLQELGARNLDEIEKAVARHDLDCEFERTGEIDVATETYQARELRDWYEELQEKGLADGIDFLDADTVREQVASPTFEAGLWDRRGVAMLNPAKLVWGLKRACVRLGVRLYEHTPALTLKPYGAGMAVRTPYGSVRARKIALGTNVFPNLVKRVRAYTVPVYDYALMTEPLSGEQLASIGWKNRQGLGDSANQFHYFRLSADNRILWGGYDAVYPYGGRVRGRVRRPAGDVRQARRALLHVLPAVGGGALHARVGRRHRHLLALLRVLRHRASGQGRVRGRLHGPRSRRDPLRRGRDAGPAGRGEHRADLAGHGPQEAAALPAGALRLDRHRPDQVVAGARRLARRAAQPVAADHGQTRSGIRQLNDRR